MLRFSNRLYGNKHIYIANPAKAFYDVNNIGEVYHHNIFEVDYSIVVQDNGQPVHITVNQQ